MFDYSLLRGKIKSELKTEKMFGVKMGMSSTTVTKKLNSERYFTTDEILKACDVLSISLDKIPLYFFYTNSSTQ